MPQPPHDLSPQDVCPRSPAPAGGSAAAPDRAFPNHRGAPRRLPLRWRITRGDGVRPARLAALLLPLLLLPGLASTATARPAGIDGEAATEAAAEPSFLIEAIRIEGLERAEPELLIATSRLRRGARYREHELAEAVRRIDRLPFVLSTQLALERGSVRDAYVLVVQVTEAERWFFGGELAWRRYDEPLAVEESSYLGDEIREDETLSGDATAGLRLFLGAHAMAFLAAEEEEGLRAGITHYNLFGRGVSLTLAAAHDVCCSRQVLPLALDPAFTLWTLGDSTDRFSLALAVPLVANHTLRLDASQLASDGGFHRTVFAPSDDPYVGPPPPGEADRYDGRIRDQRLAVRWVYDTSDDFLLPTTGRTASAGIEYRRFRVDDLGYYDPFEPYFPWPRRDEDRKLVQLVLSAGETFRLGNRHTLQANLRGAFGYGDEAASVDLGDLAEANTYEVAAGLRHGVELLPGAARARWGELRWETWAEVSFEELDDAPFGPSPLSRATVGTGAVWRNRWGVFRLGFSYSAFERDRGGLG
jgi:hypothetical protein